MNESIKIKLRVQEEVLSEWMKVMPIQFMENGSKNKYIFINSIHNFSIEEKKLASYTTQWKITGQEYSSGEEEMITLNLLTLVVDAIQGEIMYITGQVWVDSDHIYKMLVKIMNTANNFWGEEFMQQNEQILSRGVHNE